MPDSTAAAVPLKPILRLTNFNRAAAAVIFALILLPFALLAGAFLYDLIVGNLSAVDRMPAREWAAVIAFSSPFLALIGWGLSKVVIWLAVTPDGFVARRLFGNARRHALADLLRFECTVQANTILVGSKFGAVRTSTEVAVASFRDDEYSFVINRAERRALRAHAEAFGWSDRLSGSAFELDLIETPMATALRKFKGVLIALVGLLPITITYYLHVQREEEAKGKSAHDARVAVLVGEVKQSIREAEEYRSDKVALRLDPPEFVPSLPPGPARLLLRGEIANDSSEEIIAFRFRVVARLKDAVNNYETDWFLRCSVPAGTTRAFARTILIPPAMHISSVTPPADVTFTLDRTRVLPRHLLKKSTPLLEDTDLFFLLGAPEAEELR